MFTVCVAREKKRGGGRKRESGGGREGGRERGKEDEAMRAKQRCVSRSARLADKLLFAFNYPSRCD